MNRTRKADPASWLRRTLAKGPMLRSEVKREASAAGLTWLSATESDPDVLKARKAIGVLELFGHLKGTKPEGALWWCLPKDKELIEQLESGEARMTPGERKKIQQRSKRLANELSPAHLLPERRLSKRYSAEPTPEELADPYRTIRNLRSISETLLTQVTRSAEAHSRAGKEGGKKKRRKSLTREKVEELAAAMKARGERVTNKILAKKLGGKHPDYIRRLRKRT